MIDFAASPEHYRHWKLTINGAVATLAMDVSEDATLFEGYKLKLNSYDLGVDIELADAVQRLRFEHPEVRVVVVTSLKPRIFCAGANIYMLGASSHAHKVNFCKFTNETRCAIEDASHNSGQRYIAALNGTASGGGYELALACEEIYLVDDGNAAVSLPEVLLLGVLPGTGGLTRLVDKRKVRRDRNVRGPASGQPVDPAGIQKLGAAYWPLQAYRELDDALLHLRVNEPEIGLVCLRTTGEIENVLAVDCVLMEHSNHWLVHEIILHLARTLRRLDLTAKSFFAIVEPGSCFAGNLLELALAADRTYMLNDPAQPIELATSPLNAGALPISNGLTRLQSRFLAAPDNVDKVLRRGRFDTEAADEAGLITGAPDDLDWDDEIRLAIEERTSLSPDALTGMEASLRFAGAETTDTKIFGRLTAWQNWIFQRPNATGEHGALTNYGKPTQARFDYRRT